MKPVHELLIPLLRYQRPSETVARTLTRIEKDIVREKQRSTSSNTAATSASRTAFDVITANVQSALLLHELCVLDMSRESCCYERTDRCSWRSVRRKERRTHYRSTGCCSGLLPFRRIGCTWAVRCRRNGRLAGERVFYEEALCGAERERSGQEAGCLDERCDHYLVQVVFTC